MNIPLLVAGVLSFVGAAIHGVVGDAVLVRRIDPATLPTTRFGDGTASKFLLRVCWHLVTLTFVTLGAALAISGFEGGQNAFRGAGIVAASAFSGFTVLALAGAARRGARSAIRHPAPVMFVAITALSWWGSL